MMNGHEDGLGDSDSSVADADEKVPVSLDEPNISFFQANDTSDLRLIVEDRPLYVSKVVLSLVSPVLKTLFNATCKDNSVVEIPLPGKKFDDILEFLCSVYPDSLKEVTENNVHVLLPLAAEYKVKKLMDRCEESLINICASAKHDPEKIVTLLHIADQYHLEKLHKDSFEVASRTDSEILENVKSFGELSNVTTSSIILHRLKLFEQAGKKIRSKINEAETHCCLYHKGERWADTTLCNKCYCSVGRTALAEIKKL